MAGGVFAVVQFVTSNYISTELTDIVASLGSAAALVVLMRVWSPRAHEDITVGAQSGRPAIAGAATSDAALERRVAADEGRPLSSGAMLRAFVPYIIIIVVLGVCSLHSVAAAARQGDQLVQLAGPARAERQGQGAEQRDSTSSTG